MTGLVRPLRYRIVGGVAMAFAERYRINIWLVRLLFLSAIGASGFGLVLYLLFWIAMPSESVMLSRAFLTNGPSGSERFEKLSGILLERTEGAENGPHGMTFAAAIALLGLGIFFQVAKIAVPPAIFSSMIPSFFSMIIERLSTAFVFLTIAAIFRLKGLGRRRDVEYLQVRAGKDVDRTESKAIFGLLSSIANRLRLDVAYLRVAAILLSILTAGVVALVYIAFGVSLSREKKKREQRTVRGEPSPGLSEFNPTFRLIAGGLFLLLAVIRIATEFRWFFFNEPYVSGVMLVVLGLIFTIRTLVKAERSPSNSQLWLLIGPILLMYGVYQLSLAVFHVQLPFAARFQLAYTIAGLAFLYYAFIALPRDEGRVGIGIGALLLICTALLQVHALPQHFLIVVTQGYEFFYPLLFAACGLWLLLTND
jgi:phage shock protein PspC (stress-responsive transcriptional regulator)